MTVGSLKMEVGFSLPMVNRDDDVRSSIFQLPPLTVPPTPSAIHEGRTLATSAFSSATSRCSLFFDADAR
jgi:hypothetical protein